ncbi:uncharacterized protein A4U43_C07F21330 [Asparagus officinalis]|uniref:Major facilitator superfamily (MFS) profile domain-containing protein n=1 Tax=Asparagus officinalis TaxID=4686 RepID=A0A5P1EDQ4_ASPOF|nr:uncharacterized protein A4U43_C07F21330 [Asparagus officinalis]
MDAVSIRVPYHHLERGSELELVDIDGRGESTSIPISSPSYDSPGSKNRREEKGSGLRTLVMSCMVGAGVQFGWALQLSLLTPYVQGPARALLADLSGPDQCNSANAIFCSWMAVGNILGYSAGASGQWTRWFPFLKTKACCEACANLKAAFLVAVAFLLSCMSVTLYFAKEVPLEAKSVQHLSDSAPLLKDSQHHSHGSSWTTPGKQENGHDSEYVVAAKTNSNGHSNFDLNSKHDKADAINAGPSAVLVNLLTSLRHLPPGMHSVLLVMALTWTSWFPFFLFDTDWMGREVYHGNPNGNTNEIFMYQNGVREGAFGLLLNSVVLGISSFLIDPMCRKMGSKIVWAMSNFIVFICMAATTIISFVSLSDYSNGIQHVLGANNAIKIATLVIFSLLGFPLAITYSVPFSVTAELTAGTGGGQGLATGVLNLAIVIPQMLVSLGAGPWDALFGGGNIPAFFLAAAFSLAGGIIAILKLPKLSNSYTSSGFHGFG